MKILFLQNTDDALGGISQVNCTLMKAFSEKGEEISLISMRHSGKRDEVTYPEIKNRLIINEKRTWNCPRYSFAIDDFIQLHFVKAVHKIIERLVYDWHLRKDYQICRRLIEQIKPDIIINSHYELLDAIPKAFLKKTINHFHTSFDQVLKNRSYINIFKKYRDKIGKFVWLTKASSQKAIENGFKNSTFIYNPLAFSSLTVTSYSQKSLIFLGRFAPEKRLDRAVRIFDEVVRENQIKDWRFDIYGTGYIDQETENIINQNKYIHLCGVTDNVSAVMLKHSICILTSEFEGMALVILEANECGLPVICFDFGESVYEEVLDQRTGYIIKRGDVDLYKKRLLSLMTDEELRSQMGYEAKKFAFQFRIDNIINVWYDLFEFILKDTREI